MNKALLQQALNALEQVTRNVNDTECATHLACAPSIQALRAELAKPEPEPIWYHCIGKHGEHRFYDNLEEQPEGCTPLYGVAP